MPVPRALPSLLLAIAPLATAHLPALAGQITGGNWQPSACGASPVAPTLDLKSADAYNKSVDGVNTYRLAIQPYIDCLIKEANADIQTITRAATEAQRQAKEAHERIQADVRQADEKFK